MYSKEQGVIVSRTECLEVFTVSALQEGEREMM